MNQFNLLKHIIATCDEALIEAFQKRMSLSGSLAESKQDLGREIFDDDDELRYVQQIAAQFPPDLTLKATSLWSSLTRMHRGQQYRWILKKNEDGRLLHEQHMAGSVPEGMVAFPAAIAGDLPDEPTDRLPCPTVQEAIDAVCSGRAARVILRDDSAGDADSVCLAFYRSGLYINSVTPAKNGRMLYALSDRLVLADDANTMTLAFAVKRNYGSLTQALSILAEAKLNIERMRLRRSIPGDGHPDDLVFIDLSGDFTNLETRAALYQMEKEMYFFRVLGFWNRSAL